MLHPLSEDGTCLGHPRKGDEVDGRHAREGHGRLKSGEQSGSDAFDTQFPGAELRGDHDEEDDNDQLENKKSDPPRGKGRISPRHHEVETYAAGEKFGDEKAPKSFSHEYYRPDEYSHHPEESSHNVYRPEGYPHDSHHPHKYPHDSYSPHEHPHDSYSPPESSHGSTSTGSQLSQTQPDIAGKDKPTGGASPDIRNDVNEFFNPIFIPVRPNPPGSASPSGLNTADPAGRNGDGSKGSNGLNLIFGPFGAKGVNSANGKEAAPVPGNGVAPTSGNGGTPATNVVPPRNAAGTP